MPTLRDPRVKDVRILAGNLEVLLRDGRMIGVPLSWLPRLEAASASEQAVWEISAAGYGIHWPIIDEDLSVEGLLRGEPAA